ncbi:hypothetical protein B7P43_G10289 [Cryptotermes secundus]|nr:hypothetical protein B7P43_G10289 [Cryptotermes secundus]
MALRWVQQNIAHFGGDPDNVTVGGVSAGGASVHLHVLSPMSKGLFHHAIAQSGSALCPWAAEDPSLALSKAFRLGEALGCKTSDSKKLLEFLMKVPAQKIVEGIDKALEEEEKHPMPLLFVPVIEKGNHKDEAFLREKPTDIIKSGKFNKVPLIIGGTSREGLLIMRDLMEHSSWYHSLSADLEPLISVNLKIPKGTEETKEISHKIKEFYFGDKPVSKETWPQLVDVCRKYIIMLFLCQNIAVFNEISFCFPRYMVTCFSTFGHTGVLKSNKQNPRLLFICTSFHSKNNQDTYIQLI